MEMIHRCGSTKSRKQVQVHTVVRFKEPKNNKITKIKRNSMAPTAYVNVDRK